MKQQKKQTAEAAKTRNSFDLLLRVWYSGQCLFLALLSGDFELLGLHSGESVRLLGEGKKEAPHTGTENLKPSLSFPRLG